MTDKEPLYQIVDPNELEDPQYQYYHELIEDESPAEVALCTLSAINFGKIKSPEDLRIPCDLAVRGLDSILDLQDYPVLAARIATKNRRPLGIGIINLAYFLAKNDLSYQHIDRDGLQFIHEYAEAWSFYLTEASVKLAEERGACPRFHDTKYSQGLFPKDTYKKTLDSIVDPIYKQDWDGLRKRMLTSGIRNSTLTAQMPCECQHWSNRIRLTTGETMNLHEICEQNDVDWKFIEDNNVTESFALKEPLDLPDNNKAFSIYYNGIKPLIEIEFEDGSVYKFTENHLLLVNDGSERLWKRVDELTINDNIEEFLNMPDETTVSEGINENQKEHV